MKRNDSIVKIYDSKIDYCGPKKRWIHRWIPRRFATVDFNLCCYQHDLDYEKGGDEVDRRKADKRFRICIITRLSTVWWIPLWLATWWAERYYVAVKLFGHMFFSYAYLKQDLESSNDSSKRNGTSK